MIDFDDEEEREIYMLSLHRNAVGHLCFECYRPLRVDDVKTISFIGGLPIYHHSACFFPEDKLQEIIENNLGNKGLIYD